MVKYAAVKPGARELEESVGRAREFISMDSESGGAEKALKSEPVALSSK